MFLRKLVVMAMTTALVSASDWSGAVNQDWSNAGNWSAGVPSPPVDARFNAIGGGSPNTINLDTPGSALSIIFNSFDNPQYIITPTVPANTLEINDKISFTDGGAHTINAALIYGGGSLVIQGIGVASNLTLTGDNTAVIGGMTINDVLLSISDDIQLGTPNTPVKMTGAGISGLNPTSSFALNRNIELGTTATSIIDIVNAGVTLTTNGSITETVGGAPLTKHGNGTLFINAPTTFTGLLTISEGIYSAATNTQLGGGPTLVLRGATLQARDSFSTNKELRLDPIPLVPNIEVLTGKSLTLTGTVADNAGAAQLNKTGGGTLLLNGINTYSGPTNVQEGILSVNSALPSIVNIAAGARLKGIGSTGAVTNDGIIAPGNSIGSMTVASYTHNAGATFELEINAAGAGDVLNVTNGATLNGGTLSVLATPGVYIPGTLYSFLVTGTGLTGTFGTVIENAPGDVQVNYLPLGAPTFAQLEILGAFIVAPNVGTLSGNARSVQNYLFSITPFPTDNPDFLNVITALLALSPEDYKKGLINLSPAQFGALAQQNLQKSITFSDPYVSSVEQRMWCDRCALLSPDKPKSCPTEAGQTTMWGTAIGQWLFQDSVEGQYGYRDSIYGISIGATHLFRNNLMLSGGFGYSYASLDWKQGKGEANTNTLYIAPSIGYSELNYFVNLLLQGGFNWHDVDRKIRYTGVSRTAHNTHMSYDLLARVDGGYKFRLLTSKTNRNMLFCYEIQ
ncbi:MAG: autotransporter domain-containing protein [Chlamydiia bacterium]|nr:autotransporter domain-containing protein [Chlamydiia bacterium]